LIHLFCTEQTNSEATTSSSKLNGNLSNGDTPEVPSEINNVDDSEKKKSKNDKTNEEVDVTGDVDCELKEGKEGKKRKNKLIECSEHEDQPKKKKRKKSEAEGKCLIMLTDFVG